jgi:cytochrome c553
MMRATARTFRESEDEGGRTVIKGVSCWCLAGLLLTAAPGSAPGEQPGGTEQAGAKSVLKLPHELPLRDYEKALYAFLFKRDYAAWTHDKEIRDTGPFIGGAYHGTHPAVRIYYSPEVISWLNGGRKGEIADGGMIIKEMFYPPAALYYEPTFGQPPLKDPAARAAMFDRLMFAWTVMVKDSSVAKGGWFYSDASAPNPRIDRAGKSREDYDKAIEAAARAQAQDSYQLLAEPGKYSSFPGSGTALGTCQRCHASAAGEMTFSALNNIQGQPIRFRIDDSWRDEKFLSNLKSRYLPELFADVSPQLAATRGVARSLQARPVTEESPERGGYFISPGHLPPPRPFEPAPARGLPAGGAAIEVDQRFKDTFEKFLVDPPTTSPKVLPGQWADHVVAGTKGAETYITSDNCLGCHGGLGGGAAGLTMFVPAGKDYGQGYNVSEYGEWRWSPMGLAGRDPIFHAQIESELEMLEKELPADKKASAQTALTNLCLGCHGAMGQRQLAIDAAAGQTTAASGKPLDPNFKLEYFDLTTALTEKDREKENYDYHKYGNLAREGVSCTICHRIEPPPSLEKVKAMGYDSELDYFLMRNTTGRFERVKENTLYGPFDKVAVVPMEASLGITPKYSAYFKDSRLCGSCHAINLPNVDAVRLNSKYRDFPEFPTKLDEAGPSPDFKGYPHSLEQATFVEWQNSVFANTKNPKEYKSCQDCHMPGGFVSQKNGISREEERVSQIVTQIATIQDTTYPMAEHTVAPEAIHVPFRGDYKRHEMVGLNVFVESMFDQFYPILGVDKFDPMTYAHPPEKPGDPDYGGNKLAIGNMVRQAREETVDLRVKLLDPSVSGQIAAEVTVTNKVGHRFPSGVGFRRAFLEVLATKKSNGEVVWGSGRTNSVGVIVDGRNQPLRSEFLPDAASFQPHYEVIDSEDKVQIYEELTLDAKDRFTTSFIHRDKHPKDNRLLARGWLSQQHLADRTKIVKQFLEATGPEAEARNDPDYGDNGGKGATGTDHIQYLISLPGGVNKDDVTVTATMYYQSIPPYYLAQRFKTKGEATRRLYYLTSRLNTKGTPAEDSPIKDWKLRLVSMTVDNSSWERSLAELVKNKDKEAKDSIVRNAVIVRLNQLNPGLKGGIKIPSGAFEIAITGPEVRDISPVRAIPGLQSLFVLGQNLIDISPLRGMMLTSLNIYNNGVSDLSALQGMKIRDLDLTGSSELSDLSPLKGMPLGTLTISGTKVSDLTPLKEIKSLWLLNCSNTPVTDLSPLEGLPLENLSCDFKPSRDAKILRAIKTLKTINGKPADRFWIEVDAQALYR